MEKMDVKSFSDLSRFDDENIQKLLYAVDFKDLAVVLKSSGNDFQEKIFRNLSQRAEAMLKDDIKAADASDTLIKECQERILAKAQELAA